MPTDAEKTDTQGRSTHADALRAAGLRVTAARVALLDVLRRHGPHQNADALATAVRARLGVVSTQAVYDGLHALVGVGLLRRIEPANAPALYEARVGDNHHHLVCRRCGTVRDVDCVVGQRPCLEPSATHGFALDEAEVIFWGVCPGCQATLDAEAGTASV